MPFNHKTGKRARRKQQNAQHQRENILVHARREVRHISHFFIFDLDPIRNIPHNIHTYIQQTFYQETITLYQRNTSTPNYIIFPIIALFSILLYLNSYSAYLLVKNFLQLPSVSTITRWLRLEQRSAITYDSLNEIKKIITEFRQQNNISSQQIDAFVSIDAFSVKPTLEVTDDGIVRGSILDQQIDQDELAKMKKNIISFENFCKNQVKFMINDVFVINLQPLNASYSCHLIHKIPQTNGNANNHIINELLDIINEIKKNKINIIGIAYDGDRAYNKLTNFWVNNVIEHFTNNPYINFSQINPLFVDDVNTTFCVDPLHILKRYRYRLLKKQIHQFFTIDSPIVDIQKWNQTLELPSVVFLNNRWTEMNDDLPLKMFKIKTIHHLFEVKDYACISYIIIPTLLNVALSYPNLNIDDRIYILKSSFTFLLLYQNTVNVLQNPLKQKPSKNSPDVRLFDNQLISDTLSCISSLLHVLEGYNENINLNRVGSNPIEHLIGLFRMLSRNEHTYKKLKSVISKSDLAKMIKDYLGLDPSIIGRVSSYGVIIKNEDNNNKKLNGINPVHLGISMFYSLGFPLYKDVVDPFFKEGDQFVESDTFAHFISFLYDLEDIEMKMHIKKELSSRDLETGSIYNIKQRLEKSGTFFKQNKK